MDISYKSGLAGSTLIISDINTDAADDFSLKMITKNRIPGLLPVKWETVNGSGRMVVDISSRQSLIRFTETHLMKSEYVNALLNSLLQCAADLDEYLLDMDIILISPEMIFTGQQGTAFYYCCCPVINKNVNDDIKRLFEFLTGCIDYDDSSLVKMVYEMNMVVQQDNFSLKDIKECLMKYRQDDELKERKMFEPEVHPEDTEAETDEGRPFENIYAESIETDEAETDESRETGFGEKLGIYLKEKSIRQIIADIDDGVFLSEVKRSRRTIKAEDKKRKKYPKLIGQNSQQGTVLKINKLPAMIGNENGKADIRIKGRTVSKMHAKLYYRDKSGKTGKDIAIEDLDSTNGTYLNGKRLYAGKKYEIKQGDSISFADQQFVFEYL